MAELRSKGDGSSLQKQQSIQPHRPGRKITCYYCGYILHEKHLQAHMKQCDLVLEGCPNKCGVTVERQEMKKHLENECMNLRRSTGTLQIGTPSRSTVNLQSLDFNTSSQRQDVHYTSQRDGMPEEWNDKVVAALMVIKKALLTEENERCRAEAEWKLEVKKLNQRLQNSESSAQNSLLPQVTLMQFHELKEEVLLLKESLLEEKQKRYQIEQQLAYEVEKSVLLSQQIDELNLRLQEYADRNEAWKFGHEEEVNKMLEQVDLERQQRLRAETELKMEAAKLEDLCYSLEQWKNEDKDERYKLQDQHKKQESDWKKVVEQQKTELEELRNAVANYSTHIDEFRDFLAGENVMISGLWTEQLAEVRNIKEKIDSINKSSENKSKELAQLKQWVKEFDEAIVKRTRSNNITAIGNVLWKITDFEEKMADAKQNDTVLHSPVFYSSQYGYKLRVEIRLNGLGQWTGRHMTASLQVLEGEWDPLLQWPFNQKVTLVLRDQTKPPDKVNDMVKHLAEGQQKEDPAGLHVFIPHDMLRKHNYVVNNIMFLEAKIV